MKESEDMGKKDGDNGKKLKIFNKKLRQIQYLKEKFERGEALTEHEKEKLEKKSEFEKKAQLILNALP